MSFRLTELGQSKRSGFSLLEILIALCMTCLLIVIIMNWFTFIQKSRIIQTQHYTIERAVFYQLEAYPEEVSLKTLQLSDELIEYWIDTMKINIHPITEKCRQVTVSFRLKKPIQNKTIIQQERLFCHLQS